MGKDNGKGFYHADFWRWKETIEAYYLTDAGPENFILVKITFPISDPDLCGSVGYGSSHKVKDHRFNSLSGHIPGLQVRSLVGMCIETTDPCFSLRSCFSPSLSPSPSL